MSIASGNSYIYNHKAKEIVKEGVYVLYNKGMVVYVGKSQNVYKRISEHIDKREKEFDSFDVYGTPDRDNLEKFLICLFHPKYNLQSEGPWVDINDGSFADCPQLKDAAEEYNKTIKRITAARVAKLLKADVAWVIDAFKNHEWEAPIKYKDGRWDIDYEYFIDNNEQIKSWIFDGE